MDRPFDRIPLGRGRAVELWCEDAVANLARRLRDRRADVVVTSPPYNLGAAYRSYSDRRPRDQYLAWSGAVAAAVKATRLLLLTDVAGVLDADKRLLSEMTANTARRMIAEGIIYGGMIPKVETCLDAVDGGVEAAVILDGRVPHAILLELFTDTSGAGTLIRAG